MKSILNRALVIIRNGRLETVIGPLSKQNADDLQEILAESLLMALVFQEDWDGEQDEEIEGS